MPSWGLSLAPSPWLSQRSRRPHQIVGDRGEGEAPIHLRQAAQFGPAQAGDGLDPAERLLDPLADALALGVARMARGAPVDRRASAAGVAGDVRAHIDRTQLLDKIGGIKALV